MENAPVLTWFPPKMLTIMGFEGTRTIPRRIRGRTNGQRRQEVTRVFPRLRLDILDRVARRSAEWRHPHFP